MVLKRGDWVRIQRDETRWPSRKSWPLFRGRIGRLFSENADALPTRTHIEWSVIFDSGQVAWFVPTELVVIPRPKKGKARDIRLPRRLEE